MVTQGHATTQLITLLTATNTPKGTSMAFPAWDTSPVSVPLFLECVATYKTDTYFNSVANWLHTLPGMEHQSLHIYSDLFSKLPPCALHPYPNNLALENQGFEMLAHLLDHLSPSCREH